MDRGWHYDQPEREDQYTRNILAELKSNRDLAWTGLKVSGHKFNRNRMQEHTTKRIRDGWAQGRRY